MNTTYEDILHQVITDATFEEIFDVKALQKMQDEFAKSLGIAAIITDVNGDPITRPSNFTALCSDYVRATEEGLCHCKNSDSAMCGDKSKAYSVSRCLSGGLMDGGVGFFVGDRHIGNWNFGQVRFAGNDLTYQELRERSELLKVSAEDFSREYERVPVMPEERFEHVARFASIIAAKYSDEGYLKCVHKADELYKIAMEKRIQEEKERLQYENTYDYLTGLYNRNSFEQEMQKQQILGTVPVAVIVADVNNLKLTNDVFGHKFGDQLLYEIARIMKQEAFEGYVMGRCGGDEFNVMIPGGNRQNAEWFCHRVRLELAINYNCCVLPSVAFGVGKKEHDGEVIKDFMEVADQKMYLQKVRIKQEESFMDNVRKVMIGRKRMSEELCLRIKNCTEAFADFLGFDLYKKDMFLHLTEIHNYGSVILDEELYSKRFGDKLPILEVRELSKIPVINGKLANLYPAYAGVSGLLQNFAENYDGTGMPNGVAGKKIPELSRHGRVVCDYLYVMEPAPVGLGLSEQEAKTYVRDRSGKKYDPDVVNAFFEFLENYTVI